MNKIKGEVYFLRRRIKTHMKDFFDNDTDIILDIGCGENPFYKDVVRGKVIGIDKKPSKYTTIVGDVEKLSFKNKKFDKVLLANSLYYFDNPQNVIKKIHRILKNNGKLFISIPFFYPIHDVPDDKYRFTEFGLRTLLNKFFHINKVAAIGGFFTIPSVIIHSLMKGLPLVAPNKFKKPAKFFVFAFLYVPYLIAQLVGLLDFIDKTKRWTTYYVVIATKKNVIYTK